MADRDSLRRSLIEWMSESEEEGEIEDDNSPKNEPNHNQVDTSSESSEGEEGDESLDIKPPPAMLRSKISRKVDRKKSSYTKHDSHRREHRHHRERSSHTDQYLESSKKKNIKMDSTEKERHTTYKEREKQKDDARIVKDIRVVRLNKDIREHKREGGDTKFNEERRADNFDIKKMEWREKRLNFIEKKREQNRTLSNSTGQTQGSASNGKDLRDKLREHDRLQRERRLERFRSPPKSVMRVPSSVVVNKKEKELHITPEPTENEEPMEYEDESDKKNAKDDGDKKNAKNKGDKKNAKDESESDTENESGSDGDSESESNTDSKSEASSQSSEEEKEDATADESSVSRQDRAPLIGAFGNKGVTSNENHTIDSSSSSGTEEEEAIEKSKPVKSDVPTKLEPVAKMKEIFSTYLPAIQGCRSVDEFNSLTRIEEGTYGVVYRATEKATGKIVALKRLKMEKEKEGFPITSLREINTLLKAQHHNIVSVREIVVGSNIDRIYIVMDYVEHDLRSLMKTMTEPFTISEVKDLMIQLLRAVAHLHDNWILHRDLKPSNLLLSHEGTLKVGDFGLAREYGSPLKSYTPVVVTLWYRAPELLLGTKKYSTPIDMWSVGCIFGELLTLKPLFPGESEIDQLKKVFKELGTPSEKIWPGFKELPLVKKLGFANYPYNRLKHNLPPKLTDSGFDLMNRLLTYNPEKRITAEKALSHEFIEKNLELQNEVDEKTSIAGAVARFNLVGASTENQSDQSLKGGGGFTLKF